MLPVAEQLVDEPMPLTEHLVELRRRLIVSLSALAVGTLLIYRWSGQILSWLAHPVGGLIFTAPTDAFLTRLKVAMFGGLFLSLPLILHQAWLFVARALEARWRRFLLGILPLSYALFLLGAAVAVFVVVPGAMRFLLAYGSEDVRPLLNLNSYLEFVTHLGVSFGLIFQMPLALYFLNRVGLVTRRGLASRRQYVYLLAFLLAGIATPGPDVFSQIALALPTVLLFELTLLAMS